MEQLLRKLYAVTDAWKAQFDAPRGKTNWARMAANAPKPNLPLAWTIYDGILFLDGIWIAPVRFIDTAKLDACAEQVQPVNFALSLIDGSLDIIIIQEFGEYRIHAIERHI